MMSSNNSEPLDDNLSASVMLIGAGVFWVSVNKKITYSVIGASERRRHCCAGTVEVQDRVDIRCKENTESK
jgi:hypothetical protein